LKTFKKPPSASIHSLISDLILIIRGVYISCVNFDGNTIWRIQLEGEQTVSSNCFARSLPGECELLWMNVPRMHIPIQVMVFVGDKREMVWIKPCEIVERVIVMIDDVMIRR
jgi:hypothetical protein